MYLQKFQVGAESPASAIRTSAAASGWSASWYISCQAP